MPDNDIITNPGANTPPTPVPANQQPPVTANPVTDQSQGTQAPQTQVQQNGSPSPQQQNPQQQVVSNQPASDANADHPAVKRASLLYRSAQALAGGPRYQTTIDADGNRVRTPVQVTGRQLGLALALEAVQGSLAGLAAGRGRGPGAAGMAALSQQMAQQQEARDREKQEANEDANTRASALVRKAQATHLNAQIILTTAEAESRGVEMIQKIADQNKQLIDDYADAGALQARGVTQQELLDGMKSGKYNATSAIGPIDGYRLVGDGRVEATHSVISDPSAKVPMTEEQYNDFAKNHVRGFPKGVKIVPAQVSGTLVARANEQKNAFMLAQARHDEVTTALQESDDPKVKALAAKVPSIGNLLDDPKTSPGLITALQKFQRYTSHADFSHGGDLYDSLKMMSAPSKPDGKGGFIPNPDSKYAEQVANAFGGWDVLQKYHEAVAPLEIKNENDAADMLASNKPGSRAYKYAQRWTNATTQAKANTAGAEAKARAAASATSARNEDGSWNMNSLPVSLVEGTMDPSQLSKRSADYNSKLESANAYSMQRYGKPFDIAKAQSDYGYAKNVQTQNTLKALDNIIQPNGAIDIAKTAAAGLPALNSQTLNKVFNIANAEFGDHRITDFRTAMLGLADNYSKVQGGGVSTDSNRQQSLDLLKEAYSKGQLNGAMDIMRKDLASVKSSKIGDNRYLQKQYGTSMPSGASSAPQLSNIQINPQTKQQIGWNGKAWVDVSTGKAVQ